MFRNKATNNTARAVLTSCLVATTFIFVPAANATPAMEAENFQTSVQQHTLNKLVEAEMAKTQTVKAPVVAATPETNLSTARLEVSATTPDELAVIRAEEARVAAEAARVAAEAEAARQAEAARVAAEAEAARQAEAARVAAAAVRYPSQAIVNSNASKAYQPGGVASTRVPLSSGNKNSIVNSALAQVGERQDCTRLVADAIATAGFRYTGMANLGSIGTRTTLANAQPGDILHYANGGAGSAHVAIYIGGGKAVHGGWAGNQTVIASVNPPGASAPVVYSL